MRLTNLKEINLVGVVYQEKPVDPVLQTGESQLLGGEMRLAAKWVIEKEKNNK